MVPCLMNEIPFFIDWQNREDYSTPIMRVGMEGKEGGGEEDYVIIRLPHLNEAV